jgi:hypothetical protein
MDELMMLQEAFGSDEAPSLAAETRARTALIERMQPPQAGRPIGGAPGRHRKKTIVAAIAVAAAIAVTGAVVVLRSTVHDDRLAQRAQQRANVLPFPNPASVAQYLENAAWSAEQHRWIDPRPDQFMYVETLELRNRPSYENEHPNDAIVPGRAENRKVQQWDRIDGQVTASVHNGKLDVVEKGGTMDWDRLKWDDIAGLTTPDKVADWVERPKGSFGVEITAMIGQYVLPPKVQAAMFRYLARQPGMRLNPDAVNIDGRPAIGLGRVLEGYLAQELLFDQRTYALIGERLVAIKDNVTHGNDGDAVSHKGDVFRQVIYAKMIIVDQIGDTK